jgi:hypothetical protein
MNIANRTASLETSVFFSPAKLVASSGMGSACSARAPNQ